MALLWVLVTTQLFVVQLIYRIVITTFCISVKHYAMDFVSIHII